MTDQRQLIDEQIAYYRARASEYDDWWFRRGRYDRGDVQRQGWAAEIVRLETALDEAPPLGTVLELACRVRGLAIPFHRHFDEVNLRM